MLVNHHVLSLMREVWKPLLISKKKWKDFISDLYRARSMLMTHWVWAFCLKESSCDWPLELRQCSNPGMDALRSLIRACPNWKWAFKTPKADHLTVIYPSTCSPCHILMQDEILRTVMKHLEALWIDWIISIIGSMNFLHYEFLWVSHPCY